MYNCYTIIGTLMKLSHDASARFHRLRNPNDDQRRAASSMAPRPVLIAPFRTAGDQSSQIPFGRTASSAESACGFFANA